MGEGSKPEVDVMDLTYFIIGMFMLLLSGAVVWYAKSYKTRSKSEEEEEQGQGQARGVPLNRRRVAIRNRRAGRGGRASESDDGAAAGRDAPVQAARDDDESDVDADLKEKLNDPKVGAKKRAKLEAKLEKRSHREAEERMREDKKARQAKEEMERQLREEQEKDAEKARKEEETRLREEQAQRELEEYNKMKEAFTVEDEGCDLIEESEEANLLEKFINHVEDNKVVLFEELATQFGLKVPEVIDRLKILVEEKRLTGVMDDRGKFIFISDEELKDFGNFIKNRGRVQILELAENSATLITLTPRKKQSSSTSQ